jgi:hypothetical protein
VAPAATLTAALAVLVEFGVGDAVGTLDVPGTAVFDGAGGLERGVV